MGKEGPCCCGPAPNEGCGSGCGKIAIIAALFIMLGMIGGAYLIAQGDYAPRVNVGSGQPNEHTISASATSSQKVAPDLLMMGMDVRTDAKNAKDAMRRNAEVVLDLKNRLTALGLGNEEIQTTSYSVNEITESRYVCETGTEGDPKVQDRCYYNYSVTGYRATSSLTLSVKDLTKGGDVIDAASASGQNETFVTYSSFTLRDETRRALEKNLLRGAAAEAMAKAQNMAQGAGATLGKAVSVSESSNWQPYYSYYNKAYAGEAAGAPDMSPATNLSPGQVEVSATVSAAYEIS